MPRDLDQLAKGQFDERKVSTAYSRHSLDLSSQSSDMKVSEQAPKISDAAYFATTSWSFPRNQDLSASISQKSASTISPRNTRDPTAISPSCQNLRLEAPSSHQSSQAGATKLNCSSSDTKLSKSRDSFERPRSVLAEVAEEDQEDLDDYMDEDEFAVWMSQQHEEETRSSSAASKSRLARRRSSVIDPRNPPIVYPLQSLGVYVSNGIRLTPNSFVELQDGDFMKIIHVVNDTLRSEITLRGFLFRRTKEMNGLLNRRLNEVCWILHVDEDDPRGPLTQGLETRSASEVIGRRAIRLTNRTFPDLSFRADDKDTQDNVSNQRVLVCRYKYLCVYPNAKARMAYAWCEKGLHRLREDECDKRTDNDVKDNDLREIWRGTTVSGGTKEGWLAGEREFLRQEAVSHRGESSRQSLETAHGHHLPSEDIMQRMGIGFLLYEAGQSPGPGTSPTTTAAVHGTSEANFSRTSDGVNLVGLDESTAPSTFSSRQQQQQQHLTGHLRSPFSACDALTSDHSEGEAVDKFEFARKPRTNSIEALVDRETSPQVIEIDTTIKTSNSSGTLRKHYEGKITSYYTPKLLTKRKQPDDDIFDTSMRSSKKTFRESAAMADEFPCQSIAPFNIDSELGTGLSSDANLQMRNQRMDSVEGLLSPAKIGRALRTRSLKNHGRGHVLLQKSKQPCSDLLSGDGDVIDLTTSNANASPQCHDEISSTLPSRVNVAAQSRFKAQPAFLEASVSPHKFSRTLGSGLSRPSTPMQVTKRQLSLYPEPSPQSHVSGRKRGVSGEPKQAPLSPPKVMHRRYTFGDCFCGAGGMSRSAVNAGLRVDWGFDFNLAACQSYEMNFFGTPVYNLAAHEFSNGVGDRKVDICHLSPPCQFFSNAHTIQGKDDEMNTASLFAIFSLLEKAKPRVATLEQTSGLIRRHPLFFNAVINMFNSKGFSVRWRVMNCADFGLPQSRSRLFIIASWYGYLLSSSNLAFFFSLITYRVIFFTDEILTSSSQL